MSYITPKKAFYDSHLDHDALLEERLHDPQTVHLGLKISGHDGFFTMVPEIYESIISVEQSNREIVRLTGSLPPKAMEHFTVHNLIDEIVLSNEIENVHSTRKEISNVLKSLETNHRTKRFSGLVNKYAMLNMGAWSSVNNSKDVRDIFDALVSQEIEEDDASNLPDGKLFRKESVSVYDSAQREVHVGINPEKKIIEYLDQALTLLNDDGSSVNVLARISAFHFLFGYIHPFYDGNGRTNRFISSQYLAQQLEPIVGFGLSYTIKERLGEYYKVFKECEDPLNCGDITPFVISFCSIVDEAIKRIEMSLRQRKEMLDYYSAALGDTFADVKSVSKNSPEIAFVLLQASLFSEIGITIKELTETLGITRATMSKKLKELSELLPIKAIVDGRERHYSLDLKEIDENKRS